MTRKRTHKRIAARPGNAPPILPEGRHFLVTLADAIDLNTMTDEQIAKLFVGQVSRQIKKAARPTPVPAASPSRAEIERLKAAPNEPEYTPLAQRDPDLAKDMQATLERIAQKTEPVDDGAPVQAHRPANQLTEDVQAAFTEARNGKGLFGLAEPDPGIAARPLGANGCDSCVQHGNAPSLPEPTSEEQASTAEMLVKGRALHEAKTTMGNATDPGRDADAVKDRQDRPDPTLPDCKIDWVDGGSPGKPIPQPTPSGFRQWLYEPLSGMERAICYAVLFCLMWPALGLGADVALRVGIMAWPWVGGLIP